MVKLKQILIVFTILTLGLIQTSQALTMQEILSGQGGQVLGATTLAVTATANGSADSSATTIATSGTLNVNAGDLLVAVVAHYNSPSRNVSSLSDGTNSFILVPNSRYTDADGSVVEMWYKENASAKSAATFTANLSGAALYRRIMVWQISGAATSGALDQVAAPSSAVSTAQACNNIITTQADEIILAGISEWFTHTYTTGSNFTNRYVNSGNDFIALDRIVASTGTYPNGTLATVSSASDNKYACVMASFKANLSGGTPDTTAPTVPTGLSASAVSSSSINLSWSASTDAIGVTGYKVYRAGTQIGTTASTNYSDTGLSASTSYSYTVAAYDAAGNTSSQSTSASATTQSAPVSDTTAPTVPTGLSASAVSSSGINLSWTASTDNVGVVGYKIYRNGSLLATSNSTATTYSDTGLSASTSYSYTVAAYDAANNTSSQSISASTTTQAQASGNCSATNIRCVGSGQEYATISAAAAATVAGDTVVVYPGIYNERVSITRSGSSGSKITYQGFIPGSTCPSTVNSDINSRGLRPAPTVKMQGFDVNANYVTMQCFEITGTGSAGAEITPSRNNIDFFDNYVHDGPWVSVNMTTNGGVASTRASYVNVLRNYVYKSQYGIIMQCNNCTVQDNEFERMAGGSPGTDLDYSRVFGDSIIIRHNYMHGNNMADCTDGDCHIDCVQTWNIGQTDTQATNITIDRNVCFNSHEGIIARDTTHASPFSHNNWTITNNVFSDGPIGSTHPWCMILEHIGNVKVYNNVCNAGGAGFYDGTNVTFKNNIYINGGYNPYGISASGWGNGVMDASSNNLLYESGRTYSGFAGDVLNKDPKFVNLASYNFHLQSGSPAIDAAASVGVTNDLDGASRPQGAGYDIGAYEYASGGGSSPAPIPGDLNLDHVVNSLDFSLLNSKWNQNYPSYDLNGDGFINSFDYAVLKNNWGKTW